MFPRLILMIILNILLKITCPIWFVINLRVFGMQILNFLFFPLRVKKRKWIKHWMWSPPDTLLNPFGDSDLESVLGHWDQNERNHQKIDSEHVKIVSNQGRLRWECGCLINMEFIFKPWAWPDEKVKRKQWETKMYEILRQTRNITWSQTIRTLIKPQHLLYWQTLQQPNPS